MFSKIFFEKEISDHPLTRRILSSFEKTESYPIEDLGRYFSQFKKPYLEKRKNLNLYIGRKKGEMVKPAPDAYGLSGQPHFYYVHAFNCIYECQYCYLQGHFNSPDIVWFVNHEEILLEMQDLADKHSEGLWFHAGEFSDSLALSHITGELPYYHQFCKDNHHVSLELRTKSVNSAELKKLTPLPNFIVSVSLSSHQSAKSFELKVPSVAARLKFLQEMSQQGHPIALHLDPIIYTPNWENEYQQLIEQIYQVLSPQTIRYISLGIVRFPGDIYREVEKNYPESSLLLHEFGRNPDGKMGLIRPLRQKMLNTVQNQLLDQGQPRESLYFCMED